jgi:hypothetical protein
MQYQPDEPRGPLDLALLMAPGFEPAFDSITSDFLLQAHAEFKERCGAGSLVEAVSLGRAVPWLYRLTFATYGLGRVGDASEVQDVHRHTIALRFLPDYLRHADRFEMLRYILEPGQPPPFHPNICPQTGAVCIEIFPGESLLQIAESLHDLLRWRVRQLAEQDALNKSACNYGRSFIHHAIDERPLFGRRWELDLEPLEAQP